MINTKPLSGYMELLPGEQVEFDRIKKIIEETYASYGFTFLDTPAVERREVLMAKGGEELDKQIYFVNNGLYSEKENETALRFDLTVPLARYVSEHFNDLTFPFRRAHIAKVYRGERAQKGRFREFYQCDIDIIGRDKLSINYDAEIPSIIYEIFKKLDFGKFKIKISNRKLFNGLFDILKISAPINKTLHILDKIEKMSESELESELKELELNDFQINELKKFISIKGSISEVISGLKSLNIEDELFLEGILDLETITNRMLDFGVNKDYFELDLSIVRGLDYYTGTVYETVLENSSIGSVCSGGRYEALTSNYSNQKMPGVGISIGLSRLFFQLREIGIIKAENKTNANVIIIPAEKENISGAIKVSNYLREKGFKVDIILEESNMKKKFAYVDKLNPKNTVVIKTIENKELISIQQKINGEVFKKEVSLGNILESLS
ncbi:MAG: histidine--tRNA ligase [Defluviitaleaceae bacterium]|nr:histidine--tRNA ligase [Defluviitaleaceae bacterium]